MAPRLSQLLAQLLLLLWLPCLPLSAAHAQHAGNAETARAQAEQGVRAYAQGDYTAAVAAFQQADRLQPNPAFAYDTGRAYEALHAPGRALECYRDYLKRAPSAPDRAAVQARIAALQRDGAGRTLHTVWLRTQPEGATVWIDTEPVGRSPVSLQLPTGVHRASFRLEGHRTREMQFELQPAQKNLNLDTKLASEAQAPSESSVAPRAPRASTQDASKTTAHPVLRNAGFGAILASVTALGGALAFEVMRADSERNAAQQRDLPRASQASDRAQTQKTLSRIFAGAGGGLAAIGITLLVLSRDEKADQPTSRVALHCAWAKCRAELSGVF